MLALTPDVEHALRWFDVTHDVQLGFGIARYQRVGLPGPGNVGEQDAPLMEALDLVKAVQNDMLRPKTKKAKRTDG